MDLSAVSFERSRRLRAKGIDGFGYKGRSGRKSGIPVETFKVDTPEKYRNFYYAVLIYRRKERLEYILPLYPELLKDTHEHLAELLGMERPTVSKMLKEIREEKR